MLRILETLKEIGNQIDGTLTDGIARLVPWLAPAPTAWLVGASTIRHLGWPVGIGIVAAVVVESLGLASVATALTLRDYNRAKRKSDPTAPFVLASVLVGVYLAVAILLTVALDIVPVLAVYSPAIFPLLSLTGVTVLALRSDHKRRLQAIAQEKAERKAARNRNRKPARVPETVPARTAHYTETGSETRQRATAILAERPGISGSELGRKLGRSERLGRKLKAELLPVISGNGRGT